MLTNNITKTLITLAHNISCMFTFFIQSVQDIAIRDVNQFNNNKIIIKINDNCLL